MPPILQQGIGIPFGTLVLGVVMSATHIPAVLRARATRAWARAPGRVMHSEMRRDHDWGAPRGGFDSYTPDVRYEYHVQGIRFLGSVVSYKGTDRESTLDALQRYPAGAHVTVFVDPQHPERAVLETNASRGQMALALAGVTIVLAGAAWIGKLILPTL